MIFELAGVSEAALLAPELAEVVGPERVAQISVAVELAFQHGPLHNVGGDERQVAVGGETAQQAREGAVQAHLGQHEDTRQPQMRAAENAEEILHDAGWIVAIEQWRAERAERARPGAHDRDAERYRRLFD